jgi:hypothetical protein
MTDKNEVGYWIKRKGHEKFEDTKPELGFKAFAQAQGYVVTKGEPVWIDGWRLTPDFDLVIITKGFGELLRRTDMVILIDGRYHWTDTQAKKDKWRDGLYVKAGKKVIHIDAPLTDIKYWVDLAYLFKAALEKDEPVIYIHQ